MNRKQFDLREVKKLRAIIDSLLVGIGLLCVIATAVYAQPLPSQPLESSEDQIDVVTTVSKEAETKMEEPVFKTQELFQASSHPVEAQKVTMDAEETNVVEEAEVQNVEEIKEHPYYYVIDEGFEYYLDEEIQDYLWDLLKENGLEEHFELFLAQLYHESQFVYDAVSGTGDYGIAQINQCNHGWLKEQLGITDFLDPEQSIRCQVCIMKSCLEKYDDVERALVCYNRGNAIDVYSTEYSVGVLEDMKKLVEIK
jgi:hypothetical protein